MVPTAKNFDSVAVNKTGDAGDLSAGVGDILAQTEVDTSGVPSF